ncbi:MAG: hypothetical protein AAGA83_20330 [Cyanobacteria bacterium P01_F01_bin.116]
MQPKLEKIIFRDGPSDLEGNKPRLVFRASFDIPVENVDASDFILTGGLTGEITVNPRSAEVYDIVVTKGNISSLSNGEIVGIDLAEAPTIRSVNDQRDLQQNRDAILETVTLGTPSEDPPANEPPVNAPPANTPPTLEAIIALTDLSDTDNEGTRNLVFQAVFSETVNNIDVNDFIITGNTTAKITGIRPASNSDPNAIEIIVEGGDLDTFSGKVGLDLAENFTINSQTTQLTLANPNNEIRRDFFTLGKEEIIGSLSLITEAKVLDISQLGTAKALSLTVEISKILTVGSLKIFSTDANGGSRQQIGAFSVVENTDNVLKDYTPTFNLLRSDLLNVTHLQFELEENSVVSIATPTALGDGSLSLTFDDGTKLIAGLEKTAPSPTFLVGDTDETIDLTGLTGTVTIEGTIRREAALDNVVDLYATDANGAVYDKASNSLINPGEAGYKEAAIANRLNIDITVDNGKVKDFKADLTGGQHFGIFATIGDVDPEAAQAGKDIFFSHNGANNGLDQFKILGNNTFGLEDQSTLMGENIDFNDMVVSFNIL